VCTLTDVAEQVPEFAALESADEIMQFLRATRTVWSPNRGDEMSRALAFSFLLIFVAYPLHPEQLLLPLTEDLLPSDVKLPTPVVLPSREPPATAAPPNVPVPISEVCNDAEVEGVEQAEEEEVEDLLAMSRQCCGTG
jgi:hypothetical protein